VDDSKVLRYPKERGVDSEQFQVEYEIVIILDQNPRIIRLEGHTEDGIYLERAVNGDMHDFLAKNDTAVSLGQRLMCCRQAAKAVDYTHSKYVLHCDIRPRNLLLDKNLGLKLADFQRIHLSIDKEAVLNGQSRYLSKSPCPRNTISHVDVKTDLFALGSTMYFIITGHEVFPGITDHGLNDESQKEVQRQFRDHEFPRDSYVCSVITAKCWKQAYSSATEILQDIEAIEKATPRKLCSMLGLSRKQAPQKLCDGLDSNDSGRINPG
jgi:serine/threonine protein kinase